MGGDHNAPGRLSDSAPMAAQPIGHFLSAGTFTLRFHNQRGSFLGVGGVRNQPVIVSSDRKL
jgi:hypothetical protein